MAEIKPNATIAQRAVSNNFWYPPPYCVQWRSALTSRFQRPGRPVGYIRLRHSSETIAPGRILPSPIYMRRKPWANPPPGWRCKLCQPLCQDKRSCYARGLTCLGDTGVTYRHGNHVLVAANAQQMACRTPHSSTLPPVPGIPARLKRVREGSYESGLGNLRLSARPSWKRGPA